MQRGYGLVSFRHERFTMGDKLRFESKGTHKKGTTHERLEKLRIRKLKQKKRTLKRPRIFADVNHALKATWLIARSAESRLNAAKIKVVNPKSTSSKVILDWSEI